MMLGRITLQAGRVIGMAGSGHNARVHKGNDVRLECAVFPGGLGRAATKGKTHTVGTFSSATYRKQNENDQV